MLDSAITFKLPRPWPDQDFSIDYLGAISFLVGPNGSGKSRFANALKYALPNARLLDTDRLFGMTRTPSMNNFGGDFSESGYQKSQFSLIHDMGNSGSGVDAFIILEERPDIRVIVEATLSSVFGRDIILEWDSGNLVPRARLARSGDSYRMDREECHGIRELLVLLTHLHYDRYDFLIIDEPELNLHPQFQAFFVQEARKIAGKHISGSSKKGIILVTHSPFILDLRTIDDMGSIFCFSSDHQPPRYIGSLHETQRNHLASLMPKLNVHHKQLFFADNPIFVEGISDARLIEAIQERRNASIVSAGSCLIDVGGCEEVTKYVELCRHYDKAAYFIFDLDSLFTGNLRKCLRDDGTIAEFLGELGLGTDFAKYCGELDQVLTSAVRSIENAAEDEDVIAALKKYFLSLPDDVKKMPHQRVAVLVELAASRDTLKSLLGPKLTKDIEGRLHQVANALQQKHIFLLCSGALEHYLPSYSGSRYKLSDGAKKKAVDAEVALLSTGSLDETLAQRYGELYKCIEALPAKSPIDIEATLQTYVSSYIHDLQGLVIRKPDWTIGQVISHIETLPTRLHKLIHLETFERQGANEFHALLKIVGSQPRFVEVTHDTNAGMRRFKFRRDVES